MTRTIAFDACFMAVLACVVGIALSGSPGDYVGVISPSVAWEHRLFPFIALFWALLVLSLWIVERTGLEGLRAAATGAAALGSAPLLSVAYFNFSMYAYVAA